MLNIPPDPGRFMRSLLGTEPLLEYCRRRKLPLDWVFAAHPESADFKNLEALLSLLPLELQAQIEEDFTWVYAMSGDDATEHLMEAARSRELPPESVPSGPPLALWFFLYHFDLFREVSIHHAIRLPKAWHCAQAPPGLVLADLDNRSRALSEALREFFQTGESIGRFCTVAAHRLSEAVCFVVQVAGRMQVVDVFTDAGEITGQKFRPVVLGFFVYYPGSGTVLLQTHAGSRERLRALIQCFGKIVLGSAADYSDDAFNLEPLKHPFRPLPDSEEMTGIRVKRLHLRYPARHASRVLTLQTHVGDNTDAIPELLQEHGGGPVIFNALRVSHAELEVTLCGAGGTTRHLIQLWPDSSSLAPTPLGMRLRGCLQRWGLAHV